MISALDDYIVVKSEHKRVVNGVMAFGIDPRPVDPVSERKSVSSETTFNEDIADKNQLEDHLWWLCEKTAYRAKMADTQGRVLTLKLKTQDFRTRTRRLTLPQATQLAQVMFRHGRLLLAKECDGSKFRLIGIGISDLEPAQADIGDLIDETALKRAQAERAADLAKSKFGKDAVLTGRGIKVLSERQSRPQKTQPTSSRKDTRHDP